MHGAAAVVAIVVDVTAMHLGVSLIGEAHEEQKSGGRHRPFMEDVRIYFDPFGHLHELAVGQCADDGLDFFERGSRDCAFQFPQVEA
jgi:hypothetical protein